jgi:hypothetical protein
MNPHSDDARDEVVELRPSRRRSRLITFVDVSERHNVETMLKHVSAASRFASASFFT